MNSHFHIVDNGDDAILFHGPRKKIYRIDKKTASLFSDYIDHGIISEEIKEIVEELESIPSYQLGQPTKPSLLERLSIITTQTCNCKCKYCFADEGTYNDSTNAFMKPETYRAVFSYIYDQYPEGIGLVQFFGGEPLLAFKYIKEAVPICREIAKEHNVSNAIFSVVTNGTLFNQEMIDFFNKENIKVAISIDGTKEINDMARISKEGYSVYDKIVGSMDLLNKDRKFQLFAEATLNKNHIKNYKKGIVKDWLNDIRSLNTDGIIVGVVETELEELKLEESDKETFQALYGEVVDYFFERMEEDDTLFVAPDLYGVIMNICREYHSYPCAAGYGNLAVNTIGEIYPCYQFAVNDDFRMAKLENQKIVESKDKDKIQKEFMDLAKNRPIECKECWLSSICNLWCRGMSYNKYKNMSKIMPPRCWIMETAVECTIKHIVHLQENPEEYKKFVKNMLERNKLYSYRAYQK